MNKSNVYSNAEDIKCSVCGKSLMKDPGMSMVNIIENINTHKIVYVKPCCKGKCDKTIERFAKDNEVSGWKDLSEFTNPYLYIKHVMSVFNSMSNGIGFENKEAFEDYKKLLIDMYPYITRNLTDEEIKSAAWMNAMPF